MYLGMFRYFNWTTVGMVCESKRNPQVTQLCLGNQKPLSEALHYNVTAIKVDGFSNSTNYGSIMEELGRQTRGNAAERYRFQKISHTITVYS